MQNKADWAAWHNERYAFAHRETEGFTRDLEALKQHILKLEEVCPKDKANWPAPDALTVLVKLHEDHFRFDRLVPKTEVLET